MTEMNDDLNLQDLWQQSPPVNVDQLVESVNVAQKKMRRLFYYELAGSLVAFVFLIWMFVEKMFGDQWWLLAAIGLIAAIGQVWTWSWRRDLWNAYAKSPEDLFALKRKHLLLDIKIARSAYVGVVVGAVVGAVISYFDDGERAYQIAESVRISLITFAVALLIGFVVWGIRKEVRARKALRQLDKQIEEFNQ